MRGTDAPPRRTGPLAAHTAACPTLSERTTIDHNHCN
ncbi:hypothetical protein FAIPA1_10044 [Frankia sp. AiPs1]